VSTTAPDENAFRKKNNVTVFWPLRSSLAVSLSWANGEVSR